MATLPEQQRRAQLVVRNGTLRDLWKLWPAFDPTHINDTWPAVEAGLLVLIHKHGATSSSIARQFYERIRSVQKVKGVATPIAAAPDEEVILKGLRVVGPANAALQLAKGRSLEIVRQKTLVNISGEVTRSVLEHGRMSLTGSLVEDRRQNGTRPGVERITSGSPCEWCAEQAAEIYPPTERFPAHMHCSCFPSPTFR